MTPRSAAWHTDLALLQQSGSTVEDHGSFLVVRTPDNPAFHWGNFLLLDAPPAPDAVDGWLATFADCLPGVRHRAIGVDLPHGSVDDLAPLGAAGLEPDLSTVLTRPAAVPFDVAAPEGHVVRTLEGDDDWAQRLPLTVARYADEEGPGYADFVARRISSERVRCEAGHGAWWGAFDSDGSLRCTLGVFDAGGGLARYQDVETHPGSERRGLASAVLAAAGAHAADALGATTLVIVADPEAGAVRLYRRLGFTDTEVQLAASRPGQ